MKFPKRAKRFRVGGIAHTVKHAAGLATMDGSTGACHADYGIVIIERSLPDDVRHETLVHEIVEAINARYELGLSHPTITSLSAAMYQAIRTLK